MVSEQSFQSFVVALLEIRLDKIIRWLTESDILFVSIILVAEYIKKCNGLIDKSA